MVSARLHRHEGPVLDTQVEIIRDDSKFLVVNKPASIPIHPCGRFRNNSLVYILAKEFGYRGLLGCHRIDRLTSGIVIFGKTKNIAQKVTKEISSREVEKEYICKVVGEFPSAENGPIECTQPVCVFSCKLGYSVAWEVEGIVSKEASTSFSRMWTDGKTSIVLCKPKTGRTHQIRVHLQYLGYPILNDPIYNHPAWGEERFKLGKCSRDLGEIVDEISKKFEDRKNLNTKFMRQGISKVKKATESCNQVEKYVNEVKKEGDGIGNVNVGEPEPELANAVKCEGITGPENKGIAGADIGFENITETDKSGVKFDSLTHSNAIDCELKPNIVESSENNHLNVLDSHSFSAQNNLDINHEKKGHLSVNEEEDLNGKSTNDNLGTVGSEDGYKCNMKPNFDGLDPLTLGLNKTGKSIKERASIKTKN
uniref:Pseudouridine synthase RsuA/RluA-like domain-containing protein n=1 Tax=Ciona savignyi TaxID=51511 RepID=H2Z6U9_CIOSA